MALWDELTRILQFMLSLSAQVFALYSSIGILSAVLVIWLVRRILKAFNLIY